MSYSGQTGPILLNKYFIHHQYNARETNKLISNISLQYQVLVNHIYRKENTYYNLIPDHKFLLQISN